MCLNRVTKSIEDKISLLLTQKCQDDEVQLQSKLLTYLQTYRLSFCPDEEPAPTCLKSSAQECIVRFTTFMVTAKIDTDEVCRWVLLYFYFSHHHHHTPTQPLIVSSPLKLSWSSSLLCCSFHVTNPIPPSLLCIHTGYTSSLWQNWHYCLYKNAFTSLFGNSFG